jgi:Zn-finger nucleic acid-binding protein
MELFERRRYYFCRYCGSFHFLDNPETDGIRVLETPARPLPCTRCKGALATAQLDDAHPVRYCTTCRGALVPRPTFAHVVQVRRTWATGQPAAPVALNRRELERAIACPSCSATMATHPYYGPGNVVIDTCDACNLVWLDFGELKQIADAPGGDRGLRKPPRPASSETLGPLERASLAGSASSHTLGAVDVLFDLLS